MNISPKDTERFWKKVDKKSPSECWFWLGGFFPTGYGVFALNHKACRAHRVAWRIAYGPIPKGAMIRHSCDIKACVNPEHLLAGFHADNITDAIQRDRYKALRGEDHGGAKLTEEQVLAIRAEYSTGRVTQKQLAKKFGVNPANIGSIIRRVTWRHI